MYFHWGGGGGGGKDKKGHNNVKKGISYSAHADNITNVLMKHHCRYKVYFYMLIAMFFLAEGTEIRALQTQGFWMLSDIIWVLF